jgi:hypothetical protein
MGRIIISSVLLMTTLTMWSVQAKAQQANFQQTRPAYEPDPGAYSPKLEARSHRMFPWASQESERQQWMADQEQRAIANDINRTKPLFYTVNGR